MLRVTGDMRNLYRADPQNLSGSEIDLVLEYHVEICGYLLRNKKYFYTRRWLT